MQSNKELNEGILKITMTIQENYPELTKYLDEMPITIPNAESPEITGKNLRSYYDSLTSLLENYVAEHKPEGSK